MAKTDSKKKQAPIEQETPTSNLKKEAEVAPESAWFFAWFKSAMMYIVAVSTFLGTAKGLVFAWNKFIAGPNEKAGLSIYAAAGVIALPLLFALVFNLIPALRRRNERNLRPIIDPTKKGDTSYFQTGPRKEDPYSFFSKGYEAFLSWTHDPKAPLLHLTGMSGSGKSSLIYAYLKPQLESPALGYKTIVIVVRGYQDPLATLKNELLTLWKKPPVDYETITPLEALRRAERQLNGGDRLLVVFDQFEEFFLLRASLSGDEEKSNESQKSVMIDEESTHPLRDFLQDFLADPPNRINLLLSYREDHRPLLASLNLPLRQEGINWKSIEPLLFSDAATFLRSCPGLTVPETRMDRVLREAARQEGGHIVLRPIVANLLGIILLQMSGHPTLWKRASDLLRGYVRDCLGNEVCEERARLLRALLTSFHTARPRTIADIAKEVKRDSASLNSELEKLEQKGLVRCLNYEENESALRVWQISHDFLAMLIERVLDGIHRTFWRIIRPWLTPAAVVLTLSVLFLWPMIERNQAVLILAQYGIKVNIDTRTIVARWNIDHVVLTMADQYRIIKSIRCIMPLTLILYNGNNLLGNLDFLRGLTSLKKLDLSGNDSLNNLDSLRGLTALQELTLINCENLINLDAIRSLSSLKILDLNQCSRLNNLDALRGHTSLQELHIGGCNKLNIVEVLRGITSLKKITLSSCVNLNNVNSLSSLQELDLNSTDNMKSAIFRGLPSLKKLVLCCNDTSRLDAIRSLISLQELDLQCCDIQDNMKIICGLHSLKKLRLLACKNLNTIDALRSLTSLQEVYINGCSSLNNIDAIGSLKSLKKLDLIFCNNLNNLEILRDLTSLQELNLASIHNINGVETLRGLTSLKKLHLHGYVFTDVDIQKFKYYRPKLEVDYSDYDPELIPY